MTAGGPHPPDPAVPGAAGSGASQSPPPDDSSGGSRPAGATKPTLTSADRAAVEGQALRRRQLRAALCHGSDRSWRDKHRVWPACVGGVVVAVLICAGIGVHGAFEKQQRIDRQEQKQQQYQRTREPASVTVTATPQESSAITTPPTGASSPVPTSTP